MPPPLGSIWPIVLKKSAMVFTAEKYASEIEIFSFGRGFPDADFTQQRAKMAFSMVNGQAVLDDRLFEHNRPISANHYRKKSASARRTLFVGAACHVSHRYDSWLPCGHRASLV